MAGHGINLVLSAIARKAAAPWRLSPVIDRGAQEVLDSAGLRYAMRPALTIRMKRATEPGTGAARGHKLASAGVNADLLFPVRRY